ncbi:MAG: twin-arginine translocation signal domain-containing protein, partial [Planctomycetales bacterium]|nr:twin-arginine translocation signal domain-containing protein [Planctomycetales bacterium]
MFSPSSRRRFLQTVGVGTAALGLADLPFVSRLPRVSADEARLNPQLVRLDDSIEPLVRLLEETPRDRLLEAVAERIHAGTSYQEVLAALMLAGVRNVQPRPSVGFKFHSVLVVNSAHLASLAGPDEERWLPIFWALDYFKS